MKRMLWIAAMLVLSLTSLVVQSGRATTMQSPPLECRSTCSRDSQCTIQCPDCGDDPFVLEPGNTCFYNP